MNKYLTELHLHTKESSSCSKIPAKQMIEEYKKDKKNKRDKNRYNPVGR